jgi:hypothetical protein
MSWMTLPLELFNKEIKSYNSTSWFRLENFKPDLKAVSSNNASSG